MPKFLVLALALCVVIVLGGCSKSDSPTENSSSIPAQLVGSWTIQSVTLDGAEISLREALNWEMTTVTEEWEINADGNYSSRELDGNGAAVDTETSTVGVVGQTMTVTVETNNGQPLNPSEVKEGNWGASGNNLTLTFNDEGSVAVMRLTK